MADLIKLQEKREKRILSIHQTNMKNILGKILE